MASKDTETVRNLISVKHDKPCTQAWPDRDGDTRNDKPCTQAWSDRDGDADTSSKKSHLNKYARNLIPISHHLRSGHWVWKAS